MGFFQSLKEDLGAAMSELMSDEEKELDLETPDTDAGEFNELLEGMDLDLSIGEAMAIANGEETEDIMTSEELSLDDQASIDNLLAGLEDNAAEEEVLEEEAVIEGEEAAIDEVVEDADMESEVAEEEVAEEISDEDLASMLDSIVDAEAEETTDEENQPEEEATEEATEEKSVRDALDSLKNASMRFEEKQKFEDMMNIADTSDAVEVQTEASSEEAVEETQTAPAAKEAVSEAVNEAPSAKKDSSYDFTYSDDTAVITEGMKLKGDIESDGNLDILGHVTGNVKIVGKLNCFGSIDGNIEAHEIFVDGAKIKGNINVSGSIKVGKSSVICGNLSSTSAVVAGAVKGDIDVTGPVILDSTAIVLGDIKSMTMQVNNGAAIEGRCSQCYAKVSPEAFFKDYND